MSILTYITYLTHLSIYTDIDEYPQTYELQKRCVNMLCRLWHAPLGPNQGW